MNMLQNEYVTNANPQFGGDNTSYYPAKFSGGMLFTRKKTLVFPHDRQTCKSEIENRQTHVLARERLTCIENPDQITHKIKKSSAKPDSSKRFL